MRGFALFCCLALTFGVQGCLEYANNPGDDQGICAQWQRLLNPSPGQDMLLAVELDAVAVYAAGTDQGAGVGDSQWRVEKFDRDTGETAWSVTDNLSAADDYLYATALAGDALYLAGVDLVPGARQQWRVQRRAASDGQQVWSMGDDSGGVGAVATAVAADASAVFVGGLDSGEASNARWRVERRDPDSGALVWVDVQDLDDWDDQVLDLALHAGTLYVVGLTSGLDGWAFRLEARDPDSGYVLWVVDGPRNQMITTQLSALVVDDSGIYLAGLEPVGPPDKPDSQWLIQKRSLRDGDLIWEASSDPGPYFDGVTSVALDDGSLYVAGFSFESELGGAGPFDTSWRVERRDARDGELRWEAAGDPSASMDDVTDLAVDGDCLFVVGIDGSAGTGPDDWQWRVEVLGE